MSMVIFVPISNLIRQQRICLVNVLRYQDASLIDNNGMQQYRIGTTAATFNDPLNGDQSVYVRMIFI